MSGTNRDPAEKPMHVRMVVFVDMARAWERNGWVGLWKVVIQDLDVTLQTRDRPTSFITYSLDRTFARQPTFPPTTTHHPIPDCRSPTRLPRRRTHSQPTLSIVNLCHASLNFYFSRIYPPLLPPRRSTSLSRYSNPICHSFCPPVNVFYPPRSPQQPVIPPSCPQYFAHTGYLHERSDFLPAWRGLHQQVSPRFP